MCYANDNAFHFFQNMKQIIPAILLNSLFLNDLSNYRHVNEDLGT